MYWDILLLKLLIFEVNAGCHSCLWTSWKRSANRHDFNRFAEYGNRYPQVPATRPNRQPPKIEAALSEKVAQRGAMSFDGQQGCVFLAVEVHDCQQKQSPGQSSKGSYRS